MTPNFYASENQDKRYYLTGADREYLERRVYEICERDQPLTIRNCFYQLAQSTIPKTSAWAGRVQRVIRDMRRDGKLPYPWIVDSHRIVRRPTTYRSMEDALEQTAEFYRRQLWNTIPVYVEFWCESNSLQGVLWDVADKYDVELFTTRGQASDTYAFTAAEGLRGREYPTVVYYFGDWDADGVHAEQTTERKLRSFVPDVEIEWHRALVTPEQAEALEIAPNPVKATSKNARWFKRTYPGSGTWEAEAIPAPVIREIAERCVTRHLPQDEYQRLLRIEEAERQSLFSFASMAAEGAA